MIREVPGVEDLILAKFEGDEDVLYDYWTEDGGERSPLEVWKKSRVVRELDRFLPVLDSLTKRGKKRTWEQSEDVVVSQTHTQNQTILPSSPHFALASGTGPPILPKKEDESVPAPPLEPKILEPLILHHESPDSGDAAFSSNDWVLPPNAGRLVEAYFSYTHMWFPIIERHDLLRILYQGPTKKNKITRSPGENAALWAVLAYAEAQYAIISNSSNEGSLGKRNPADLFYSRAKSLVQLVDGEYELGHVQATLILAVLKVGGEDWKSAWVLVGHAVRVAMNLGLDLM